MNNRHRVICLIILLVLAIHSGCGQDNNKPTPAPPSVPANLATSSGNHVVTLTWDQVADAESYNIYFSQTPGVDPATAQPITSVDSSYEHIGLENVATIHYVVTAVNSNGESLPSQEVSATPAHITADTIHEVEDTGTRTILGSVKNSGSVSACGINLIVSVDTQYGQEKGYGSIIGQTLKHNGSSDSACLRSGETGFYQIFTGAPLSLITASAIEIFAEADGISEPSLQADNFLASPVPLTYSSSHYTGAVTNQHQTDTAYSVRVNLITQDSVGLITGIYSSYVSGNTCIDLDFPDANCIPAGGTASFDINSWRDDSTGPSLYTLIFSYLEATDFVSVTTP